MPGRWFQWTLALATGFALAVGGCSNDTVGEVENPQSGGSGGEAGGGGQGGTAGSGGSGGGGGAGAGGHAEGGSGGTGGIGEGGSGGHAGEPPDIETGENLKFWGAPHGVPGRVRSVGSDQGGNVWAANGQSLLLLRRGSEAWESLTAADGLSPWPPIAVAGGADGEVWVGYEGLFPDSDPFDDPPEIAKSGDVDRIRLRGGRTLDRFHYDISTAPGVEPGYPEGRDILRTCYRIVPVLSGPFAGDVWFGCNHGVAMWNQRFNMVQEHLHTFIDIGGSMASGDFRGLYVTPSGNVWIGADHRHGLVRYGDEGGQFWARIDPEVDAFPPGVALDPDGHDWVMAIVGDGAGGVWFGSFGNGLAHLSASGTWSYLTAADGLPDNRVMDLALDPDGSLWIATDAGVIRWRGGFGQPLNGLNGLSGVPLSLAIDTTSSPRRVIIGTSTGVAIYDGP